MSYLARRQRALRTVFAAACALPAASAFAGGYLVLQADGNPKKWANSFTLELDQGPLSTARTNAQANALVASAVARWNNTQVAESALTISTAANALSTDNADLDATAEDYNTGVCGDGSPVIYDAHGYLIDAVLGAGASNSVLGFAGPYCTSLTSIGKGQAVLNGLFINGTSGTNDPVDSTDASYEGVITHEIGHLLNLDHAQCRMSEVLNSPAHYVPDYTGFPTMFPLVHDDIQDLEADDKAWIANLYPSATGSARTKITGTINLSGVALNGVNVVARSTTDHRNCITCVTGFKDSAGQATDDLNAGTFEIPMLPTDSQWVLDVEPVASRWTGGSSVGTVDPPLTLGQPTEFINDSGIESASDSALLSTTFITPSTSGGTLSGVNLTLNNVSTVNVSESDPGASVLVPASLTLTPGSTTQLSGNMTVESGNLTLGGDDVEDWYLVSPPAGVEITEVKLNPSGFDGSLFLVSYDQAAGSFYTVGASIVAGAGAVETVEGFFDSTKFGTGTAAGKIYIGVSDANTNGTGSYTLAVKSSPSDQDALVVNRPASVDPTGGTITITGRGFKNTGGSPTVAFSNSGIQVNSVTYVNSGQLDVNVTRLAGFTPGSTTDVTVTNLSTSGSYGGRTASVTAVPVTLSSFAAE